MSLIAEYINVLKQGGIPALEAELLKLIGQYNQHKTAYLFVYASAIGKAIPLVSLDQSDYYMFHDLLGNKQDIHEIDVYIETPGGSGEAAEEIVKFLRNNFDTVSFVVSGEAKSAGTIIVLSGDEILMTETGSLGPIDAQMQIGRSTISAYDYTEWVDTKRKQAGKQGRLNPFDATMVAQITPGELKGVNNALKFAEDLVIEWLVKYKFKKWNFTETRKVPVTDRMKKKRAKEISTELINHSKWRLHGRSIKIDDLEKIGLRIKRIQDDPILSDIVYKIQTVTRLMFDSTNIFKIFATDKEKIFKQATPAQPRRILPQAGVPDAVQIEQQCSKCNKIHKLYAKLSPKPQIDEEFKNKGFQPFPKDDKIKCDCGFEIDLLGIKNQIETDTGKKIIS